MVEGGKTFSESVRPTVESFNDTVDPCDTFQCSSTGSPTPICVAEAVNDMILPLGYTKTVSVVVSAIAPDVISR